eukprot:CAMPEP_0115362858 /NCGR_PEP_ID=MMETSP0270-20121206/102920_1 /TAXON_ID=71861 /ORGANISM="Scrippsiella trochoidea, Strain CCMP3099" /LENGTH=58 /DNA_ID=CAMNT_0002785439 /DNA_START=415 /DNA_END=588 /DNA_ORIENTATION=-
MSVPTATSSLNSLSPRTTLAQYDGYATMLAPRDALECSFRLWPQEHMFGSRTEEFASQ